MIPRPHAWRSPAYLAWVRDMPCIVCAAPAPSEPHHCTTAGLRLKCSDCLVIPVCRRCHRAIQEQRWTDLLLRYHFGRAEMWRAVATLMEKWFTQEVT